MNDSIVNEFNQLGVCDSKTIKSDKKIINIAKEIKIVGDRLSMVTIGPAAYNRMYAKIGNVNKILAWAHARTIENVLEMVPDCPRALADKFGPEARIKKALLERGKNNPRTTHQGGIRSSCCSGLDYSPCRFCDCHESHGKTIST